MQMGGKKKVSGLESKKCKLFIPKTCMLSHLQKPAPTAKLTSGPAALVVHVNVSLYTKPKFNKAANCMPQNQATLTLIIVPNQP